MDFKTLVLYSKLTPQVTSRIVRDLLSLQRLTSVKRITLVVACEAELAGKVDALGLQSTRDLTEPDYAIVYVNGDVLPEELEERIPVDDELQVDIKYLAPNQGPTPGLVIEEDPYMGVDLYEDHQEIPETMPLDRPAPKGDPGEPPFIPFL